MAKCQRKKYEITKYFFYFERNTIIIFFFNLLNKFNYFCKYVKDRYKISKIFL